MLKVVLSASQVESEVYHDILARRMSQRKSVPPHYHVVVGCQKHSYYACMKLRRDDQFQLRRVLICVI